MTRYCREKGIACDYANEYNCCSITACCKINNIQTVTSYNSGNFVFSRRCEICGQNTADENRHICLTCAKKLYDILYVKNIVDNL